jgi:hypothetical protein
MNPEMTRLLVMEDIRVSQEELVTACRISEILAGRPDGLSVQMLKPWAIKLIAAADALGLGFVHVRWLEDGPDHVRLVASGRDADGVTRRCELEFDRQGAARLDGRRMIFAAADAIVNGQIEVRTRDGVVRPGDRATFPDGSEGIVCHAPGGDR